MNSNSKKPYILLIEDNEQDELLTIRALEKHNIKNEIRVCRDGADALDFLFCENVFSKRNPNDLPQIVLLDLKLPKIDGIDVLKKIKAHSKLKLLPVVILTTSSEDKDLKACYEFGANSYVKKPVDFFEFSEAIKNLGIYWLLLNECAPL